MNHFFITHMIICAKNEKKLLIFIFITKLLDFITEIYDDIYLNLIADKTLSFMSFISFIHFLFCPPLLLSLALFIYLSLSLPCLHGFGLYNVRWQNGKNIKLKSFFILYILFSNIIFDDLSFQRLSFSLATTSTQKHYSREIALANHKY